MRTLLYGGSFNPPHKGHQDAVRAALAQGWAERVLIMPTGEAPHKPLAENSPQAWERAWLCQLAFRGMDGAEVSTMEIARGGVSYTADTVAALQKEYPNDEIGLLMGTDMFLSLESWHKAEELFAECHILVLPREENDLPLLHEKASEYLTRYRGEIHIIEKAPLPLSSTSVRALLPERKGENLLEEGVYKYIISKRLYGAKPKLSWLRERGYKLLKSKRIPHVQGCEEMAVSMAKRWGADPDLAAEAAILHDCTKKLDTQEHWRIIQHFSIPMDEPNDCNERLLHPKTGAYIAKDTFGVEDSVFSAILWHTTGKPDMTTLEKIIYLADAAEPSRSYPGVDKLRTLCMEDLDKAMIMALSMSIETVERRGESVHEKSIQALEWYKNQEKNK